MDELPDRALTSAFVRIGAVRDVAVEVLRHDDLRRQRAPALGHLDVLLLEDDLPAIVGDFGGPPFPFDLIKWRDLRVAEHPLETQAAILLSILFFRRAAECVGLFSDAGGIPGLS